MNVAEYLQRGSREVLSTPISMQTVGIAEAELTNSNTLLNVTAVVTHWYHVFSTVFGTIAPPGKTSIFFASVVHNNLSSIRLAYYGIPVLQIVNS